MNKTIIKLGLLLALTLPAGAMEEPEAPEAPEISARLSGARQQEIMDVLSALQKLASKSGFNEKLPKIWHTKKDAPRCTEISQYIDVSLETIFDDCIAKNRRLRNLCTAWLKIVQGDAPIFQNRLDQITYRIESLQKCQKELVDSNIFNDNIKNIYRVLSEFDTDESLEVPPKVKGSAQRIPVTFGLIETLATYIPKIEDSKRPTELDKLITKEVETKLGNVLSALRKLAEESGFREGVPEIWNDEKDSLQNMEIVEYIQKSLESIVNDCLEKNRKLSDLYAAWRAVAPGDFPTFQKRLDEIKSKIEKFENTNDFEEEESSNASDAEEYSSDSYDEFNNGIKNIYHLLRKFDIDESLEKPLDVDGEEGEVQVTLGLIETLEKYNKNIEASRTLTDLDKAITEKVKNKAKEVLSLLQELVVESEFDKNIPEILTQDGFFASDMEITKYILDTLEKIANDWAWTGKNEKEKREKIERFKKYKRTKIEEHDFMANIKNTDRLLNEFFNIKPAVKIKYNNSKVENILLLIDRVEKSLPGIVELSPIVPKERIESLPLEVTENVTEVLAQLKNCAQKYGVHAEVPMLKSAITGKFMCGATTKYIRNILENIVENGISDDKTAYDELIKEISNICNDKKNKEKSQKAIRYYNELKIYENERHSDAYDEVVFMYPNQEKTIKNYNILLNIIPKLKEALGYFNENNTKMKSFKEYQEDRGDEFGFNNDLDSANRLLDYYFDGESADSESVSPDKMVGLQAKFIALINKLKYCMSTIEDSITLTSVDYVGDYISKYGIDKLKQEINRWRSEEDRKWFFKNEAPHYIRKGTEGSVKPLSVVITDSGNDEDLMITTTGSLDWEEFLVQALEDLGSQKWLKTIKSLKVSEVVVQEPTALKKCLTKMSSLESFEIIRLEEAGWFTAEEDHNIAAGIAHSKNLTKFIMKNYKDSKFYTKYQPETTVCLEKTVRALSELPNLQYVDLSNNYNKELSANLVNGLIKLGSRPNVKVLNLKNNNIKKEDKERLRKEIYAANSTITLALDD